MMAVSALRARSRWGAIGSAPPTVPALLLEIEVVTPDHMQVLKKKGNLHQSGHRTPIRMSKTTGFPGRTRL